MTGNTLAFAAIAAVCLGLPAVGSGLEQAKLTLRHADGRVETRSLDAERRADGAYRIRVTKGDVPADVASFDVRSDAAEQPKSPDAWYMLADGRWGRLTRDDGAVIIREAYDNYDRMGLFGMKLADGTAWCGVIKGMRHESRTNVEAANGVYRLYTRFELEPVFGLYEDVVIDFYRLSGAEANYSAMGRLYRRYMLEERGCRPLRERIKGNPALAYETESMFVRYKFGRCDRTKSGPEDWLKKMPPVVVDHTFADYAGFLRRCKAAGMDRLSQCMVGFQKGGHDGPFPDLFPADDLFGGETGMREAIALGKSLGYRMSVHINQNNFYLNARRYSAQDVAKTPDGQPYKYTVYPGGQVYHSCYERIWRNYMDKDLADMKDLGLDGLLHVDVTTARMPDPCWDPNHANNRRQMRDWQIACGKKAREAFGGFSSESGFDHVAEVTDNVLYVTPYPGWQSFRNEMVDGIFPVWQVAFNGIILSNPFYATIDAPYPRGGAGKTDAVGKNTPVTTYLDNPENRILKVFELGGRPMFYYADYADLGPMKRMYDLWQPLRHLQLEFIREHAELAPGVFVTRYEDGEELVTNYSDRPYDYRGEKVPAVGNRLYPAWKASGLTGDESWGGRKAHPAVVNSVTAVRDDPYTLSLRGTWDFKALPRTNLRNHHTSLTFTGYGKTWDEPTYRGTPAPLLKIQVPGCWEAQLAKLPGYGVATGRTWYCDWDQSPKPVRGHHSGDGWYRRTVKLPESWKGRRIWLKTGWVNSQGWFWVNGKQVAMDQNYCATRKYEVTDLVRFGEENMVVVQVCNAVPSHRGCVNYSEHWGGILRDLEFEATPETFIDDAWVRGDFDKRLAEAHVEIGDEVKDKGEGERRTDSFSLRVTVEGEKKEINIHRSPSPSTFTLEIPFRDFRPWSPEHPNLYTAKVELVSADGAVLQTRFERFGVRKLEVRGRDLFLNGKPFFLRGSGWHSIDPINGYARPDREEWLGHARQVRAAGFNIVRTHTECKMPEFFEACDEAGLMVETELPYYGDVPSDGQRFDPLADLDMLWRNFRRHPSFAIYSFGNESGFGADLSGRMYALTKARDPDRLVVGQDGALYPDSLHAPNRRGTSDFAGAPVNVIPRGSYRPELPFYFHEYINSSVKLDTRTVDGFTGVWAPPTSRAARADFLGRFGLDGTWGDRLQDGQNRMQRIYLKYGLETARLNRWACGYSYWSLQDACPPQGESVVGQALWDPFWHEKSCGATTAEVAVFNSPSCVLMTDASDPQEYPDGGYSWPMFLDSTVTNLVRTSGETIRAIFHLAHYGDRPMTGAKLVWRLVADGRQLGGGERDVGDQALGGVRQLAEAEIAVPPLERAVKATLEAEVGGVRNAWTYWLFPERKPVDGTGLVCEEKYLAALAPRYPGIRAAASGDAAALSGARAVVAEFGGALEKAALAAGRRTVALANQAGEPNVTLGWWAMTEQLGAAIKAHAMTSLLPHEGLFEQFLFRIGRTGLALPVEGFSGDDCVMVGEGGKGCYLYLAAKRLPNGAERRLIAGLDVLADTREGSAILDAAIEKEME